MYKTTKHHNLRTLTNQITYNRLLRSTKKILLETVFEMNDNFTRNTLNFRLKVLYKEAYQSRALTGYDIKIKEFDKAKPNYVEVEIVISLPGMIEYVIINVNNTDSL